MLTRGKTRLRAGRTDGPVGDLSVSTRFYGLLLYKYFAAFRAMLALSESGLGTRRIYRSVDDLGVHVLGRRRIRRKKIARDKCQRKGDKKQT